VSLKLQPYGGMETFVIIVIVIIIIIVILII